jgi:ribosomal subunit interface protein
MNISVRGRHVNVEGPFQTYARRRLLFAVGEFGSDVSDIAVRVSDQNGPRGGIDKSCVVAAAVSGGPVLAHAAAPNPYAAVDRAAQRLRARVARHLERRRSQPRRRVAGAASPSERENP